MLQQIGSGLQEIDLGTPVANEWTCQELAPDPCVANAAKDDDDDFDNDDFDNDFDNDFEEDFDNNFEEDFDNKRKMRTKQKGTS